MTVLSGYSKLGVQVLRTTCNMYGSHLKLWFYNYTTAFDSKITCTTIAMAFKKWTLADLVDHERSRLLHNILWASIEKPDNIEKIGMNVSCKAKKCWQGALKHSIKGYIYYYIFDTYCGIIIICSERSWVKLAQQLVTRRADMFETLGDSFRPERLPAISKHAADVISDRWNTVKDKVMLCKLYYRPSIP